MKKEETLNQWRELDADQPIMMHMDSIPYKSEGSSYGACGVRIDGSPAFIDAVLSHLKEMISGENGSTRLELARNTVDGRKLGKRFDKALPDAQVCYIRLHERGGEAQQMNAFIDGVRTRGAARRKLEAQRELVEQGLN